MYKIKYPIRLVSATWVAYIVEESTDEVAFTVQGATLGEVFKRIDELPADAFRHDADNRWAPPLGTC